MQVLHRPLLEKYFVSTVPGFFHSHFQAFVICQTTDVTEHQKQHSFHARPKNPVHVEF